MLNRIEVALSQKLSITDTCLIVEDLHRSLAFYRDALGFVIRRHAPGFADFKTAGVTLAIWERNHLVLHTGIECPRFPATGRSSMIAIEQDSPSRVDDLYSELSGRGVAFLKKPSLYPWNAYACYFEDPDHHLWELYAWGGGGHAGLIK